MESRLPDTSDGTSPSQNTDGTIQPFQSHQRQRRQFPTLLSPTSDWDTFSAPEGSRNHQITSQPAFMRNQVQATEEALSPRPFTPSGVSSSGSITGSVKYTRTGRVSKAAKGRRIHTCQTDGCEKVFSRAEHLRRHQLSHQPANFACEIPGCTRTFTRKDLLMRHRARHPVPHEEPGRPLSSANHTPTPDTRSLPPLSAIQATIMSGPIAATTALIHAGSGSVQCSKPSASTPPKRRPMPPNELALSPLEVHGPLRAMRYYPWHDPPALEAPSAYDRDSSPDEAVEMSYFQDRGVEAVDRPCCLSRPPTADSSHASTRKPKWSGLPLPVYELPLSYEDSPCGTIPCSPISRSKTPDCTQDAMKQQSNVLDVPCSEEDLDTEKFYMNASSAWVHAQLPILHKPRLLLNSQQQSPLPQVAVPTRGGAAMETDRDVATAHENACDDLFNDSEAKVPSSSVASVEDTARSDPNIIETLCKQRLLLTYYLLIHKGTRLPGTLLSSILQLRPTCLPFPFPKPYTIFSVLAEVFTYLSSLTAPARDHQDLHQCLLLITAISDPDIDLDTREEDMVHAIEHSTCVVLARYTMLLCRITLARALLTILLVEMRSGDCAVRIGIQEWAPGRTGREGSCVRLHLPHVIEILTTQREGTRMELLRQGLAVLLAGLVIWSGRRGYGYARKKLDGERE